MKLPAIYYLRVSGYMFELLHIHTGFNDYSLLRIVNGKLLDILFMRLGREST
jgi:hypothetical protein